MRRLYRSPTDKVIAGVCGGLGEYLNIDSSIIRLIWIFFVLFAGVGILVYIVAALIIPVEPHGSGERVKPKRDTTRPSTGPSIVPLVIGIFLLVLGVSALGHNLGWHVFRWHSFYKFMLIFFPAVLILFGILLVLRAATTHSRQVVEGDKSAGLPSPDGEVKKTDKGGGKRKTAEKKADSTAYSKPSAEKEADKKKKKEKDMPKEKGKTGEPKKLYRNMDNRMISGVCAGLADYLEIDVSIVRLIWVFLTLATAFFGGVIAYFLMVVIVPPR